MPTKKSSKKRPHQTKEANRKGKLAKKAVAKKAVTKKAIKKKAIKKKAVKVVVSKRRAGKPKSGSKKRAAKKGTVVRQEVSPKARATKNITPAKHAARRPKNRSTESQIFESDTTELRGQRSGSAIEAGDLQGLSEAKGADSESVDELVEEGNAFEAGVIDGVERADNSDEEEVRTHEVPEDDVPEEYLDQD